MEGNHVQTPEKIFPETALRYEMGKIVMGSSQHPCVYVAFLRAAQATEAAVVQEAQELNLHGRAHLADLVEEESTSICNFAETRLCGGGGGEGPLLMPEEFTLQQLIRQGATVEGHEGLVGPIAEEMQGPGQILLAGASFSRDHHRYPAGGDAGCEDVGLPRTAVAGEHVGEVVLSLQAAAQVIIAEAVPSESGLEVREKDLGSSGAGQIVARLIRQGGDSPLKRGPCGQDEGREGAGALL